MTICTGLEDYSVEITTSEFPFLKVFTYSKIHTSFYASDKIKTSKRQNNYH